MTPLSIEGGAGSQDIVLLQANETRRFNKTGRSFQVIYCSELVEARINDGPSMQMASGMGVRFTEGAVFNTLELRNTAPIAQTVVFYAGFAEWVQTAPPIPDPETEIVAVSGLTSVANGASVTITPAITGRRFRRKAITITNEDVSNRLRWRDASGTAGGVIFPETTIMLPVSETMQIQNPNAVSVACLVSEIYFLR